ncbi:MAG: cation acetate symporter [Anaerosomatales bacterium]|nr:cation acetate symporter [Anaerosomatales bacterium]
MGLNTLAIVLVVILISMTIALSVFSRRFTRTTADFYLAGRKVGSFANASAISGDYLSAASFLGVAAAVYASGLDGVWYAAGFAGGFIVVVLFIASPLRRFGEYTVPDFAFGRFNTNRMRLVSVVGVLATSLFYMAPQMYGAGTTWKVLVGRGIFGLDPYQSGVVVVALIIMIYVAVGGMKGTTLNQIIQFWWLAFAMILVVIFATFVGFDVNGDGSMRIRFNYPETLASQSEEPLRDVKTYTVAELTANDGALLAEAEAAMRPEAFAEVEEAVETGAATDSVTVAVFAKNKLHTLKNELLGTEDGVFFNKPGHRYNGFDQFSMVLALVLGTAGLPHILNRYYTNPSGSAARRSTFWVLVFIGVFYILAPMAGLAGREFIKAATEAGTVPQTADFVSGLLVKSDALMPTIAQMLGGEILMGIVAAGAFAAMFSTLAGLLIASASAVGHDVYEKYINKDATEKQKVFVGKASVVFFALLALTIGLIIPAVGLDKAYPALIAMMVTWAFAVGAGAFVPMLLTGIWWKGTTERGAIAGMIVGGGGSVLIIFMNMFRALGTIPADAGGIVGFLSGLTFPSLFTFPLAVLAIVIVSKIDGQLPKNVDEIWMRIHGTAHERYERQHGLDKVSGLFQKS